MQDRGYSMPESNPRKEDKGRLTITGYIITFLSVIIIFGSALPIVQWRNPETGQPLPKLVAVVCPVLIGAVFHSVASAIFSLIGFPVLTQQITSKDPAE